MLSRLAAAAIVAATISLPQSAVSRTVPAEVKDALPNGQVVGTASVTFLFWSVFDAALWNANGQFSWEKPFALTLFYRTDFSASELVDSSIEEMDRLTDWSQQRLVSFRPKLQPCMRSVDEGDRITALSPAPDRVALYYNGTRTCELQEPGLRSAFFSIWLSANSKFPDASRKLTGQRTGAD